MAEMMEMRKADLMESMSGGCLASYLAVASVVTMAALMAATTAALKEEW